MFGAPVKHMEGRRLSVDNPGTSQRLVHAWGFQDLDVARDIVLKRGYVLVYPDQMLGYAWVQGTLPH